MPLCRAHGCKTPILPHDFMCRDHWTAVRPALRRAVLAASVRGQEEDDSRYTARYMAVTQRAIAELVATPNDEASARVAGPYIMASERWRQIAIDRGEGDPLADLIQPS